MRENLTLDDIDITLNTDGTYTIVVIETGEILESEDHRLNKIIEVQKIRDSINDAKKKAIKYKQGKVDISETHHTNWKQKSHFIKIYRSEMREYKKNVKLSPGSGMLLLYIQDYIQYGTNKVVQETGENFTNEGLRYLTGISPKTLSNAIKELEDKLFIIRSGSTNLREIFFNPYLMCGGNEVLISTVKLFDDAGYIPITPY